MEEVCARKSGHINIAEECTCETPYCTKKSSIAETVKTVKTWQTIRDKDIQTLYERTKAAGGYSGPYGPFRRAVSQADLGGSYVENAPSDTDLIPNLPDDIKEALWLAFE